MKVGRGRIETGLDSQRAARLARLFQALPQLLFADDLGEVLLQLSELFVNGQKVHILILNAGHDRTPEWVQRSLRPAMRLGSKCGEYRTNKRSLPDANSSRKPKKRRPFQPW